MQAMLLADQGSPQHRALSLVNRTLLRLGFDEARLAAPPSTRSLYLTPPVLALFYAGTAALIDGEYPPWTRDRTARTYGARSGAIARLVEPMGENRYVAHIQGHARRVIEVR